MIAALALGFFGSLHCAGMCGPIAASLPGHQWNATRFFISRLLYNSGRLITYSFLGLLVGAIGYGAKMFLVQQYFSLVLGILIVLWGIRESGLLPFWKKKGTIMMMPFRNFIAGWFKKGTLPAVFGIGMANGLLPCGFVYMGLFLAAMAGSPLGGAATMALFGLGTFPTMLLISYSLRLFAAKAGNFITRTMPYAIVLIGCLFVLRGMALGIPYVSPKWVEDGKGGGKASCCVKADDACHK